MAFTLGIDFRTNSVRALRQVLLQPGKNAYHASRNPNREFSPYLTKENVPLEVRDLSGPPRIRNVSFKLRKGEIIGLAGLLGAGRTELALLLMGAKKKTGGALLLNGRETEQSIMKAAVS